MSYVISPRINADLRASCRIRRFALSPAVIDITQPRKERSYRLGGGLTWLANQRIGLSFDIDYQRRNASGTLFDFDGVRVGLSARSEEHTSELQSLMRISYAVFCLNKKKTKP